MGKNSVINNTTDIMKAVDKGTATADVNRFLDAKRLPNSRREGFKDNISSIIDSVSDGLLIVEDDCSITQVLMFPIGEGGNIKELKYKNRITSEEINMHDCGVGFTNELASRICALTEQPVSIIRKLDTEDIRISNNIALFF